MHLGRGLQEHKLCLANGAEAVASSVVMPASRRLAVAYPGFLPVSAREHAREIAGRLLPERYPNRCAGLHLRHPG